MPPVHYVNQGPAHSCQVYIPPILWGWARCPRPWPVGLKHARDTFQTILGVLLFRVLVLRVLLLGFAVCFFRIFMLRVLLLGFGVWGVGVLLLRALGFGFGVFGFRVLVLRFFSVRVCRFGF